MARRIAQDAFAVRIVSEPMDEPVIDARGLRCPLPVLKVRKMMRQIAGGADVLVLATDPGADQDLKDYCEATGATFLSSQSVDGVLKIRIKKG